MIIFFALHKKTAKTKQKLKGFTKGRVESIR